MAKKKAKLNLSTSNLLSCLAYAIIGVLLLVYKSGSLGIVMTVAGALLIVLGVVDILSGDFVRGLVQAIIGVAIIVCGWLIVDLVLLIFGVLLIIKGVLDLLKVLKNGLMAILPALVTILIGVLLVVAKFALMDTICVIVGIIFIINAVLMLFGKKLGK